MSAQEAQKNEGGWSGCLSEMPFVKIFGGFKSATQPGKLLLALAGIVLMCAAGVVLDWVSTAEVTVDCSTVQSGAGMSTELDVYVSGSFGSQSSETVLEGIRQNNKSQVMRALMAEPMRLDRDEAEDAVAEGTVLEEIEDKYLDRLDKAIVVLEERYEESCDRVCEDYEGLERCEREAGLEEAYLGLFGVMTGGEGQGQSALWINRLVVIDGQASDAKRDAAASDIKRLGETVQLAGAYQVACAAEGRGVFGTLLKFVSKRFHLAIGALVWQQDIGVVKQALSEIAGGAYWLFRFHWLYGVVLTVAVLAIWSLFGGAICRVSALQVARDERIGAMRALKFSAGKFCSFFAAPLVPLAIIALICVVTALLSLLGAVPGIGEILTGVLLVLPLIGGFVVALVAVGLIGGANLMFPTVAVEGSDSFDAISRSFSYVFARPWRMGFYTLVGAVYGAICYLFVRFFALLLLGVVHGAVGAGVNLDGSSFIGARGKLDAIWPGPTWVDLNPAVNWLGLGGSEKISAFLICIWVTLVVGVVMAFVVSFYFSVNTMIYYLLRRRVDATDIEDVYLEQDAEELVSAGAGGDEGAASSDTASGSQADTTGATEGSAEQGGQGSEDGPAAADEPEGEKKE